uniref:Uncharacterized protein n=1 Tax=viral metagenome TaxID=1070528 RepID=A0A6C0IH94_9ZZZZ
MSGEQITTFSLNELESVMDKDSKYNIKIRENDNQGLKEYGTYYYTNKDTSKFMFTKAGTIGPQKRNLTLAVPYTFENGEFTIDTDYIVYKLDKGFAELPFTGGRRKSRKSKKSKKSKKSRKSRK